MPLLLEIDYPKWTCHAGAEKEANERYPRGGPSVRRGLATVCLFRGQYEET
jgi:hypothetical protein